MYIETSGTIRTQAAFGMNAAVVRAGYRVKQWNVGIARQHSKIKEERLIMNDKAEDIQAIRNIENKYGLVLFRKIGRAHV